MAVELLVRTTDGSAGLRERGDIVSVKQVPHKGWGNAETLPNYLVIRIDDIDKTEFKTYEGRHLRIDPHDPKSAKKRSKYRFNLDGLSKDYAKERPHLTLTKNTVISNVILKAFI